MQFFLGGYYLVQATPRSELEEWWPPPLVPRIFWTVDEYICNLFPGSWGPTWVRPSPRELEEVRQNLSLTEKELVTLREWVDSQMDRGVFGWPNVFLDPEAAREFHHRYLSARADVKLLTISLPDIYVEEFLRHAAGSNQGRDGVYQMMMKRANAPECLRTHGFEVLGYDMGSFHSFVVNYLQVEYRDKLAISLNAFGKIDDYTQATRAADHTRLDTTGAEPALWLPWRIDEHELRAGAA